MNTNEKKEITIRIAKEEDAEELLAIYAPYIEHTVITYEYDVPTVEEFRGRIRHVLERYPYLVAEVNGEICGYAYASAFHERPAGGWNVETSIYVDQNKKEMGIDKIIRHAGEDIKAAECVKYECVYCMYRA